MKLDEQIYRIQNLMRLHEGPLTGGTETNKLYKLYIKNDYRISYPSVKNTNDALFVFGGISIGGPSYVYNKVPEQIKNSRIVICCDHELTLGHVLSEIKSDFSGTSETPTDFTIKSLCAFSGGGPRLLENLGKGYFIGLMDAYIDSNGMTALRATVGKSQPVEKIRMVYELGFWSQYKDDQRDIRYFKENGVHHLDNPYYNLIETQKLLGTNAVQSQGSHPSMPREFFNRFGTII